MALKVAGRSFADVDALEKLVIHAATQYDKAAYAEDFDGVEVTDVQYDDLYRLLKEKKPKSRAFKGTTPSEKETTGAFVVHDPPLTSIVKADGEKKEEIFQKWKERCSTELKVGLDKLVFALSIKRDGCCARFNYHNGNLLSAGLRPRDGINGTDITRHAKYLKGVPLVLPLPLTLSLNAEIECHMSDFEEVNKKREEDGEDLYKNPRNYTAGCLGRDDPEELKDAKLQVTFHGLVGLDNWQHHYRTEEERAVWVAEKLKLNNWIKILPKIDPDRAILDRFEASVAKLDYYVDGVVVKVDDLEMQESLGHHGDDPVKEPHGAIAWKFSEEVAVATIKELVWEGSRTGRVVPTAVFEKSVSLADTDVSRATCNNFGWAMEMGIGPGTQVEVIKAGKIIPKVIGVVGGKISQADFKKLAPKTCPIFKDFKFEVVENEDSGSLDLMCTDSNYPPRAFKSWLFYVQSIGAKGLGPAAMKQIMDGGIVFHLADLYMMTLEDLTNCGFSKRQALLALATMHMVPPTKDDDELAAAIEVARKKRKKMPAWQFFGALGIPGAGKTVGKSLIAKFRDFDKIRKASMDELTAVDGIGDSTAEAVHEYMRTHTSMLDQLLKHVELELPKEGNLSGKNFCLTGSFDLGKKHWEQLIQDAGGVVKSSVGKTTHYLVQQHGKTDGSPSSKEQKAAEYGTQVISVQELEALLG